MLTGTSDGYRPRSRNHAGYGGGVYAVWAVRSQLGSDDQLPLASTFHDPGMADIERLMTCRRRG